jgi:hypothetical protein
MNLQERKEKMARLSAVGTAVGVGLALTQASQAATVGVNLVVNGDFEDVTGATAGFGASELASGWVSSDGGSAFAYNYAQNYDDRRGTGLVPPGNDPLSATDYYFTMNTTDLEIVQNIDLSSGETLSVVSSGLGEYDVRGFFTNYLNDEEGGRLTLSFYDGDPGLDGSGANLLSGFTFDDLDIDAWTEVGGTGAIDPATTWARLAVGLNPGLGLSSGPDIYADNISFAVNVVPEPSAVLLAALGSLGLLRRNRAARGQQAIGS